MNRLLHGSALVLLAVLAGCGRPSAPAAVDGTADLRGADWSDAVALTGTWRAHAGVDTLVFAAYDYDDADWARVPFPALFEKQGFPDRGLVWYRLHLRLPPDAPALVGRTLYARNTYEVYAARPGEPPRRLAAAGVPALTQAETVPSRRTVSFALPADTALVLSIRTANHYYGGGGFLASIMLESEEVNETTVARRHARIFGLMGACLLLIVTFLVAWVTDRRDVAALTVVFLAAITLARELVMAGVLEPLLPGMVDYTLRLYIETTSSWFLAGMFGLFVWAMYPLEFVPLQLGRFVLKQPTTSTLRQSTRGRGRPLLPRWRRHLNTLLVTLPAAITILFCTLSLVFGIVMLDALSGIHKSIIPVYVLVALGVAAQIVERRREMAEAFFTGYLLVALAGAYDLLVRLGVFSGPMLSTYAFFGFALILSFFIGRRNARNAAFVRESAGVLREKVAQRTEELRLATEEARTANAAKSTFMSAVTHELRTPLTAIKGYTQILTDELDTRLHDHEREFLHSVGTSSDRLIGLVNDLLDLERAETGLLHLDPEPVDLAGTVRDALAALYPLAEAKGLDLDLQRAPGADGEIVVQADPERLEQVLVNLVGNALKFTDTGGVRVRIGRAPIGGAPCAYAAVQDSGPGIPAEFVPRLFDRFSRSEEGTRHPGSGLGLAITHELVTRMGGRIDVETAPGAGSTFTVHLPLAASAHDAASTHDAGLVHDAASDAPKACAGVSGDRAA